MGACAEREVEVGRQAEDERAGGQQRAPAHQRARVDPCNGEGERHRVDCHEGMVRRPQAAPEERRGEVCAVARRRPAERRRGGQHDEERVQRVHALDRRLGPEARSDGEQQCSEDGRDRAHPELAAEAVEEAARQRTARGAEDAQAPGDRAEREDDRPRLPEQHVERIARRVRDAEQRDRRRQLAAVAHVDRGTGAERVHREDRRRDRQRRRPGAHDGCRTANPLHESSAALTRTGDVPRSAARREKIVLRNGSSPCRLYVRPT